VAQLFSKYGIPCVDADQISRDLRSPGGKGHEAILKKFGTADRAQLRELIFKNAQARKDLEAILHPLIREECDHRFELLTQRPALYEASLLIETGRYRDFTGLIVVEAPRENRIERVIARDSVSREEAEKTLSSQLTDEERRKFATHLIENSGSVDELEKKVALLAQKLITSSLPSSGSHA
jgi:dephospho-CoA kinase